MGKFRTIAEAVMILGLIVLGTMQLEVDKAYKCDVRGLAMNCDSLEKYYGLPNGKCINKALGNKLCRSGWDPLKDLILEKVQQQQSHDEVDCDKRSCVYRE